MKKTSAMTLADLGFGAVADHVKTKFGSQKNIMKAVFALLLWVISTLNVSAQKSVVLDAFSKHGIDVKVLNPDYLQQPANYSYELKQTTIAAGKETVIEAKFDPSGAKGEEWTVTAVNGKNPSKSDINSFRKNQKEPASNKVDESSYKVEKESAGSLLISYKLDPAAIAKDVAFMKDCRFYMTINLGTKELEQVQTLNEKPIKIKIINVEKFDIVQKYIMDDQAKRYLPTNQNLNMLGKFLGQTVTVQTISEYSNYSKK